MSAFFLNLRRLGLEEIKARYAKSREMLNTPEGLQQVATWEGKKYKGDVKAKMLKLLANQEIKARMVFEGNLNAIESAPEWTGPFIITIEWRPSRMWRSNPRAFTNFGFEGSSIGGCGYDKRSAATAEALNSDLRIIKLLAAKKEDALAAGDVRENREVLGYGSGYGIIPHFEGGVGVESHRGIIEGLGLKWQCVTDTKNTDVYAIIAGVGL
jgi:hypothetical protein